MLAEEPDSMDWSASDSIDRDKTPTPTDLVWVIDLHTGAQVHVCRSSYQRLETIESIEFSLDDAEIRAPWRDFFKNYYQPALEERLHRIERVRVNRLPVELCKLLTNLHRSLVLFSQQITVKDASPANLLKKYYADAQKYIYTDRIIGFFVPLFRRLFKFSFSIFRTSRFNHYLSVMDEQTRLSVVDLCLRVNHLMFGCNESKLSFDVKDITDVYVVAADHIAEQFVKDQHSSKHWQDSLRKIKTKIEHVRAWAQHFMVEPLDSGAIVNYIDSYSERKFIDYYTKNIYYIAIEYFPDSISVAQDLAHCLFNTDGHGRTQLTEFLIKEVEFILLNIGVSTDKILHAYASAVECLRLIDPTNIIMHKVCGRIREYLKKRPDTVKSIIMYITTQKKNQLQADPKGPASFNDFIFDDDGMRLVNADFVDEDDGKAWPNWNPDPVDANKRETRFIRQSADLFNMLVSVYGTKDQFVKEYRQMLSERLLSNAERDHAFESRYLELLKQRFVNGELQPCDVMLRDLAESELFDRAKTIPEIPFSMQSKVLSTFFWPKLEEENFKLPPVIDSITNLYQNKFETFKKEHQTVRFMPSLGFIDLEVELYGKTIHLNLPTAQAVLLMKFLEKAEWGVEDLSNQLEMAKNLVKRRCEWFVKNGILCQHYVENSVCEHYKLTDRPELLERYEKRMENEDEESDDDDENAEDTAAIDALEQYWMYTKNFIQNQEPVKAERIHMIFKMFASPGKQGPTIADVTGFLQRKVRLNLLSFNNGYYRGMAAKAPEQQK